MSATEKGATAAMDAISYGDLYRRWEQGNWSATQIDLAGDREGWQALSEIQRASGLWLYSMFFYGEDSVTDNLSPYVDAAPTEEQTYFLATQQVDEARHAIFFHRFFEEVIGTGGTLAETLASTRAQHNWGYRAVFDRLDRMADELRADHSLPKFAQAIALYHMVVESTLAQPGQHFIQDHFAQAGTMPGFTEGMDNVARDEQRHIGFGVKTLAECFRATDECKAAVSELLAEVFRYALAVFIPPGWDRRYTREYGFELEDIFAFGIRSIRTKWRQTGYPLEDMPAGVFPFDAALSDHEIAQRVVALNHAGVLGEPNGRPDSGPETQRMFFDVLARAADPARAGARPLSIQWRFADADPWQLRIKDGEARAEPGVHPNPDITLDTPWKEWVDIAIRGASPARAVLARELRPHGSPRALARLPLAFPNRPKLVGA